MIADIVELSVGIEEVAPEVVSQRRPRIETDADATVERLLAQGVDTQLG